MMKNHLRGVNNLNDLKSRAYELEGQKDSHRRR